MESSAGSWLEIGAEGTDVPPMRESFTAVCLDGNSILCFGGIGFGVRLNDLLVYNVAEARWSSPPTKGSPPCARSHHTGVGFNGGLYVFGGEADVPRGPRGASEGASVSRKLLGDMHRLDVATMRWQPVPYHKDCFLPGFRKQVIASHFACH